MLKYHFVICQTMCNHNTSSKYLTNLQGAKTYSQAEVTHIHTSKRNSKQDIFTKGKFHERDTPSRILYVKSFCHENPIELWNYGGDCSVSSRRNNSFVWYYINIHSYEY